MEQAFLVGLAFRSQTGGWDGAWSGLCEVGPDGLGGVGVGGAEEWETGHWEDGCSMRGGEERQGIGRVRGGGRGKKDVYYSEKLKNQGSDLFIGTLVSF